MSVNTKNSNKMAKQSEPKPCENESKMQKLFGFKLTDFRSWSSFVKLMNRPEDPSSLALFRIAFGIAF